MYRTNNINADNSDKDYNSDNKQAVNNHNNSTHNLTSGNIYRQLLSLSIPLIIGNILQQFYNTIDAFVVGKYAGVDEFASIGIAGTVMNLFLFIIVGACTGLSVLFARFYGTKDYKMLHRQHFTALMAGLIFSIILGGIGLAAMKPILTLIKTPSELMDYTGIYLKWIFLNLPASFLYNMYAAALRSSGDTLAALIILAVSVMSNLILDISFIAGFGLGIQGAAVATAFTQLLSCVLCILYLYMKHREFIFTRKECYIDKHLLITTIQCSLTTAVHQASLYIGKMFIQGIINTAGTDAISAYTAATRIEGFANSFGDSGSASTSILTSQNYGANNKKRVRDTFWCSIKSTAILGTLCAVILWISADITSQLMLGSDNAIAHNYAVGYLKYIALFYTLCFTGGSFTRHYNGIGKVHITLIGSIMQITIRVVLSAIFFNKSGLNVIAVATGIGWITANLFWAVKLIITYKSSRNSK